QTPDPAGIELQQIMAALSSDDTVDDLLSVGRNLGPNRPYRYTQQLMFGEHLLFAGHQVFHYQFTGGAAGQPAIDECLRIARHREVSYTVGHAGGYLIRR